MRLGTCRGIALGALCAFLVVAAVAFLVAGAGRDKIPEMTVSPGGEPEPGTVKPEATAAVEVAADETISVPVTGNKIPTEASAGRTELPPEPVFLYEHATGIPGSRWELGPGTTDAGEAFPDNEVSAVEVPAGLQVTLFNSPGAAGARVVLGPGRHNLAPYRFDERLSSVRVAELGEDADSRLGPADRVVLYEGSDVTDGERGQAWPLAFSGERSTAFFTSADGDFEAFAASSAWVPSGYELTLFVEPDGRGAAMVLGPGLHELTLVGYNDRVQSARVRRTTKL